MWKWRIIHFTIWKFWKNWHIFMIFKIVNFLFNLTILKIMIWAKITYLRQFDHGITRDGNTVIVTKYPKKWPKITAENSLRILLFTWCLKENCVKICISAFDLHSCACNYFHAKESKNNNPPLFNVFLLSLKCISMFCKKVFDFYQKSNWFLLQRNSRTISS